MAKSKIFTEEKKYLVVTSIKTKDEVAINDDFQEYLKIEAQLTELEAKKKEVLNRIVEKAFKNKEVTAYINGDNKISHIIKDSMRFDSATLKKVKPETYKKYLVPSHSDYYQITKVSDADKKFIKNGK